jgi:hypothetical protein
MDVILGVAVTGDTARLALVGAAAAGKDVIDQSEVDIAHHPVETLTETVVGTNRLLADERHRLVATQLCWTDHPNAERLRSALEDSGVMNVSVVSESQAVTALMRAAGRAGGVLVVDDNTATLSLVNSAADEADSPPTMMASTALAGDATATFDTLMARLGDQPETMSNVYLVGASSNLAGMAEQLRDSDATMRVEIPEDPTFALARGVALSAATMAAPALGDNPATMAASALGYPDATMAAPALTGDATAMAPRADETAFAPAPDPAAEDQQLAYSMADDGEPLGMDEYGGDEYDEYADPDAETGPLKLSRRSLVLGNAVIAFAVIGFASLAVAVVVGVRPTAASEPVIGHQNAAPGKFMPLLPTQQQAPVPEPAADAPNVGYQGGVIPDNNGYIPPQLMAPSGGGGGVPVAPAPVPVAPPIPNLVPHPGVPIPIPIIIPLPGWRPPLVPFNPFPRPPFNGSTTPVVTSPPTPSTGPSKQPLVSTPSTAPSGPSTPSTGPSKQPLVSTPSTAPSAVTPSSKAPSTETEPSTQPSTQAPQPSTAAPSTKPPTQQQTTVPQTQTQVPKTQVPQTQAPQTQVPQTQAPKPYTPPQTVAPKPATPQQPTVAPKPQQPAPKPVTPNTPRRGFGF